VVNCTSLILAIAIDLDSTKKCFDERRANILQAETRLMCLGWGC
jgi:hypothetical protein